MFFLCKTRIETLNTFIHASSSNCFITLSRAHNEVAEASERIHKIYKRLICKHKGCSGASRITWRPMEVLKQKLQDEQVVRSLAAHEGEGEDLPSNIEAATTASNLNESNRWRLPLEIIIGASVLSTTLFALMKLTTEVPLSAQMWSIICQRNFKFVVSSIRKTLAGFLDMNWSWSRLSYMLDVLLERHPISYFLLLSVSCVVLICIGGLLFNKYRRSKQKIADSLWDAWACICSSSTHLKEKTGSERTIGIMLALGGLLFYSLLTSTLTAQFKSHMEWLREGAHSQVMESGHVVICGENNHLSTVLKQLNASHEFAIRDRSIYARRQTVLLLSERPKRDTEKLVSFVQKDCPKLDILSRSGSLSNPLSFQKVAAEKAKTIVFLANKDDSYEADADAILSVLAIQSVVKKSSANIVVEVSNNSTGDILPSLTGMKVSPVQNLSSKLFVQCSRQQGLVDVYKQLLDHDKQVINLRSYASLAGLRYQEIRRGFPEAIVCGMIRNGDVDFHPKELDIVQPSDKFLVIARKHTHRNPPEALLASSVSRKTIENAFQHMPEKLVSDSKPAKSLPNIFKKASVKTAEWRKTRNECILILGWKIGVCDMILEYDNYVGPGSELVILAENSIEERNVAINRMITGPLRNVHVNHMVGNALSGTDIRKALEGKGKDMKGIKQMQHVDQLEPPLSIVVISETRWHGDMTKSDKKAVYTLFLAEAMCKEKNIKVGSLVAEFADTNLGRQVVTQHPSLTYIGTSELMGLVTSQVMEHRDLNKVWTELLNSWGNEVYLKDIALYKGANESPSFFELSERAILRNEVAIGYRRGNITVINPTLKNAPLEFSSGDSLVVISEFQ